MARLTQKAALAEVRSIIDRYPVGREFSEEDRARLSDLTGTELRYVVRKRNPAYPSDSRHLHVLAYDWPEPQQFSWRQAVTTHTARDKQEAIAQRERGKVLKALRQAIQADLNDFRSAADPQECGYCGAAQDLTCDHYSPPVIRIALDFIESRAMPALRPAPGRSDEIADADVEGWIAFHAQRATYQLLCRSCNSAKGAYGC